jgi:hypothetical protein
MKLKLKKDTMEDGNSNDFNVIEYDYYWRYED